MSFYKIQFVCCFKSRRLHSPRECDTARSITLAIYQAIISSSSSRNKCLLFIPGGGGGGVSFVLFCVSQESRETRESRPAASIFVCAATVTNEFRARSLAPIHVQCEFSNNKYQQQRWQREEKKPRVHNAPAVRSGSFSRMHTTHKS